MYKLWLVFKREYLIRVRKKSFILVTLLMPLLFAGLAFASGWISTMSSTTEKRILVKDASGIFEEEHDEISLDNLVFEFSGEPIAELRDNYINRGFSILIEIPPFGDLQNRTHKIEYYSEEKPSIMLLSRIEDVIGDAFREYKISKSNIDRALLESFETRIEMDLGHTGEVEEGEDTAAGSGKVAAIIGTILGAVMGIMMYMVLLIYGQMVMRSVMEEKISRIVEVMISSVKPFQLMMGKIFGVAAVGLTQLAIWIVFIPLTLIVVQLFMPGVDPQEIQQMTGDMQQVQQEAAGLQINQVLNEFFSLNWLLILPVFVLFFLGGYLIYSSLFAAIGSAVNEDLGEAQQLMLPVMIPVILAFLIMMSSIENPNGPLSVFGSIFPLFSPIIMPARLPFDPPVWQLLLSIVLLIGTTLLMIWISARIYRIGILMYGKKITFREIGKWLFYRG